jgi:hypothetical protein
LFSDFAAVSPLALSQAIASSICIEDAIHQRP